MTNPIPEMRIDAHHHCWDRERSDFEYGWLDSAEHQRISASHLPDDLAPHLTACDINRSILVQTQHCLAENEWALALSDRHDWIGGVVGWVDLASPDCESQLLRFREHPRFVGIRHVVQDEPDDFILRPDIQRGLKILEDHQVPFDLLVYPRQLQHAPTIASRFPGLKIVLDHLGKPAIRDGERGRDRWKRLLQELAVFPNTYCKLSGLVTEASWSDWSPEQLRPYFDWALEHFGPQRCLYGSDWPVCKLAASYEQVHAALMPSLEALSVSERAAVLGNTARDFYGIVP